MSSVMKHKILLPLLYKLMVPNNGREKYSSHNSKQQTPTRNVRRKTFGAAACGNLAEWRRQDEDVYRS